ncbi:MAG: hypothetical protein AAGA16_21385 [Cyanobacteria bacterium P01_E01_bin.35]
MSDILITKAKCWGFVCQHDDSNSWLILPQKANQRWKLQQAEDRWILSVRDVPQIILNTEEAIAFLLKLSEY